MIACSSLTIISARSYAKFLIVVERTEWFTGETEMRYYTRDFIEWQLLTSDMWLERGMLAIYGRQNANSQGGGHPTQSWLQSP